MAQAPCAVLPGVGTETLYSQVLFRHFFARIWLNCVRYGEGGGCRNREHIGACRSRPNAALRGGVRLRRTGGRGYWWGVPAPGGSVAPCCLVRALLPPREAHPPLCGGGRRAGGVAPCPMPYAVLLFAYAQRSVCPPARWSLRSGSIMGLRPKPQ